MANTARQIIIVIIALIIGYILYYFRTIVTYILIAWVVSLVGRPFMILLKRLEKFKIKIPDALAAAATIISFIGIIAFVFAFFVPLIVKQAENLSTVDFGSVEKALDKPIQDLTLDARKFGIIGDGETMVTALEKRISAKNVTQILAGAFQNLVSTAGDLLVGFFAVIFISFFFLREKNMFQEVLASLFPKQYDGSVRAALNDTTKMLTQYFTGILIQMFLVSLYLTIALSVLGIKDAFIVALFAGVVNIVPYIGPWMGALFAISVAVTSHLQYDFYKETVPLITRVVLVFGLMQWLNDWFVSPIIFSKRVKAHPLEIFLVTLIGAKIGGIPGMILAIPTYTVIRVIAREFFNQYRFVQSLTRSLE